MFSPHSLFYIGKGRIALADAPDIIVAEVMPTMTLTAGGSRCAIDDGENGALFAAAPDMLAALQCVVACLTQNRTFPADIAHAKKVARAAIAKATK